MSSVSHAANEENSLFSPISTFYYFPFSFPKPEPCAAGCRCRNIVSVPYATPSLPSALLGYSLPCWDPLQIQPVLASHSRVTAHSALSPQLPQVLLKAAFKSFQYGASRVGKGPLQDALFPFMVILASKPPGIRMRKKSSVSRNDSSWVQV